MAKRSARERLIDIATAIEKIQRFLTNVSFEGFCADERTHDAVVRNLEIISEGSRHVPDELKAVTPHIPWRNIADFGNWLRHGYDAVNDHILWDTINRDLPALHETVRQLLEAIEKN